MTHNLALLDEIKPIKFLVLTWLYFIYANSIQIHKGFVFRSRLFLYLTVRKRSWFFLKKNSLIITGVLVIIEPNYFDTIEFVYWRRIRTVHDSRTWEYWNFRCSATCSEHFRIHLIYMRFTEWRVIPSSLSRIASVVH